MQLIPIIIKKVNDRFDFESDYQTDLYISQLTNSIYRNDADQPAGVEILFSSSMLEVISKPTSFWQALRDIGGMLSLIFFFALFASCRHNT